MVLLDFLSASIASMTANVFTHPLETVKVRQILSGCSAYEAAISISRNGGITGFYMGIEAALLRAVVSGGGRLTGYNVLKVYGKRYGWIDYETHSATQNNLVCASLAVISACFAQYLAAPFDLIRTRQAASSGQHLSMLQITRSIVNSHGFQGLFQGAGALLGRAASFNIAQLLSYDNFKSQAITYFGLPRDKESVKAHVAGSLGAGLIATVCSSPFENIKTVMQVAKSKSVDTGSGSFLQTAQQMLRREGPIVFFRGFVPLYSKIGPHTFIVFVTMEQIRLALGVTSA